MILHPQDFHVHQAQWIKHVQAVVQAMDQLCWPSQQIIAVSVRYPKPINFGIINKETSSCFTLIITDIYLN